MFMQHKYAIYNFIVQSELRLPNLQVADLSREPSVHVQLAKVAAHGLTDPIWQGLCYQATPTQFWLNVPAVARFLVLDGLQIRIDPYPGADEGSILTFLYKVCLDALLRQRQLLVLPGQALKLDKHGVAFLGASSLGQQMLLGVFYKRGYPIFTGNRIVLNERSELLAGVAQLEFDLPIITSLGFDKSQLSTLRPGIDKYLLPLGQQGYAQPLSLDVIYLLKTHQHAEIAFSAIEMPEAKLAYLQQYAKQSIVWEPKPELPPPTALARKVAMICIQLPATDNGEL